LLTTTQEHHSLKTLVLCRYVKASYLQNMPLLSVKPACPFVCVRVCPFSRVRQSFCLCQHVTVSVRLSVRGYTNQSSSSEHLPRLDGSSDLIQTASTISLTTIPREQLMTIHVCKVLRDHRTKVAVQGNLIRVVFIRCLYV
jgi:hypothetical protein